MRQVAVLAAVAANACEHGSSSSETDTRPGAPPGRVTVRGDLDLDHHPRTHRLMACNPTRLRALRLYKELLYLGKEYPDPA